MIKHFAKKSKGAQIKFCPVYRKATLSSSPLRRGNRAVRTPSWNTKKPQIDRLRFLCFCEFSAMETERAMDFPYFFSILVLPPM